MSEVVKPIPLDVLESYLWGAAVLLRTHIKPMFHIAVHIFECRMKRNRINNPFRRIK